MSETAAESIVPFPPMENWEMPREEDLPEDDGVPMETSWHRDAMNYLIDVIHSMMEGRTDFYVGGNMFIHFSPTQVRNNDFRGPDFFFVKGVDGARQRKFWVVWLEEGRYPDVIIELLSPSTARQDRTTKKAIYEKTFKTRNYFIYDPDEERLEGWQLNNGRYEDLVPNERGWLWSEELQAWLGTWEGLYRRSTPGVWLRFFDTEGRLVPSFDEKAQRLAQEEQQRAEQARQAADQARQAAEQARQAAEQARQAAEQARQAAEQANQRALTAEEEVARLRALLAAKAEPTK